MRNPFTKLSFNLICTVMATTSSTAVDTNTPLSNPLDALGELFSSSNNLSSNELLEPDQAFNFYADVNDNQQITLNWRIADGYYLYQEKINVTLISPDGLQLKPITLPSGKQKTDEIYGSTTVYYGDITLTQQLVSPISNSTDITLSVDFQGCADIGVCYPPMNKVVNLSLQPSTTSSVNNSSPAQQLQLSEQGKLPPRC